MAALGFCLLDAGTLPVDAGVELGAGFPVAACAGPVLPGADFAAAVFVEVAGFLLEDFVVAFPCGEAPCFAAAFVTGAAVFAEFFGATGFPATVFTGAAEGRLPTASTMAACFTPAAIAAFSAAGVSFGIFGALGLSGFTMIWLS